MDDLDSLLRRLAIAKSRCAVEASIMGDYVTVRGVKLYRPTLIHLWLTLQLDFTVVMTKPQRLMAIGYLLRCDVDMCRHQLQREIEADPAGYLQRSGRYFDGHDYLLPAVSALLTDLEADEATASSPEDYLEYDWWASMVYPLAAKFGWTEDTIMRLPLCRLNAYYRVIAHHNGSNKQRNYPALPELQQLLDAIDGKK